jgi:ABC-type bacteriocin/lantibiotic exporter with double-glycine peptidase domain
LLQVARGFGLEGKGYACDLAHLPSLKLPVIVHMVFNHFAVLEEYTPQRVLLADPGLGRHWLPMAEFSKQYTGVVLSFAPGPDFARRARAGPAAWRVYAGSLRRVPGVAGLLAQVLIATLLVQLLTLAGPLLLALLVDRVLPTRRADLLAIAALALLLLSLARLVATYLRAVLLVYLRERLDLLLMPALFRHILSLPYTFFQRQGRDALAWQVQQSSALREALNVQTLALLFDGLTLLLYGATIFAFSPLLGLIALTLLTGQLAALLLSYRPLIVLAHEERDARLAEAAYLLRVVRDMESVKVTGAEESFFAYWRNLLHKHLNVQLAHSQTRTLYELLTTGFASLGPVLLLLVGMQQVHTGRLTLGVTLALNLTAYLMFRPLADLIGHIRTLQGIVANVQRLNATLAAVPEQVGDAVRPAPVLTGRLALEQVSFRYNPTAPWVLRDVSLQVEPGQKVAIVGAGGAGKSTLIKLLLGFYAPTEGCIRYDGQALTDLDLPSVRRQLGVSLQGAGIMHQTLRYNIALGRNDVPMAQVRAAARLALIDDDIMRLPQGYKTFAGENGANVSGGQRQRLLLARAFLQRAPILLLDEATSALDSLTERQVEANLRQMGSTRIVVTHRLATVRDADQIIVMHDGEVAERGRHDDLMAAEGRYAAFVREGRAGEDGAAPAS